MKRTSYSLWSVMVLLGAGIVTTGMGAALVASPAPRSQMQAVLDSLQRLGPKAIESLPPALARLQPSAADAVVQLIQDRGMVAPEKLPAVGRVESKAIAGPGGPLTLRLYTPPGDGPFPIIVYFHGGGWVVATLDTYDASCRELCAANKAVVISVDYRKAPEHKFPAAPEDCYAATQYVADHIAEFGGKSGELAVAGESAGGNLATVVCLMAKQREGKMPVAQVLIYPVTNYAFDTESYRVNANAKPLNAAMMPWFFNHYLTSPADGDNVLVSPLRASADQLRSLPPATLITAEIDPLRSEGQAYAEKLRAAGVDVAARDYRGVTHEFFGMGGVVDEAKGANAFIVDRLKAPFKGR